jgi:hypothetical protein
MGVRDRGFHLRGCAPRVSLGRAVVVMGGFHHDGRRPLNVGPASVAVGEHLGVSLTGLGVFATGYYIGYVVSNACGGVLTDWIGGRVVISSTLFTAGGFMILFGESTSAALGITFQSCIGFFAGCRASRAAQPSPRWRGEAVSRRGCPHARCGLAPFLRRRSRPITSPSNTKKSMLAGVDIGCWRGYGFCRSQRDRRAR